MTFSELTGPINVIGGVHKRRLYALYDVYSSKTARKRHKVRMSVVYDGYQPPTARSKLVSLSCGLPSIITYITKLLV